MSILPIVVVVIVFAATAAAVLLYHMSKHPRHFGRQSRLSKRIYNVLEGLESPEVSDLADPHLNTPRSEVPVSLQRQPLDESRPGDTHEIPEVQAISVEESVIPISPTKEPLLPVIPLDVQRQSPDVGESDDTHSVSEVGVVGVEEPITPTPPAEDLVLPAAPSELQLQSSDEGELDHTTSMFEVEA